ncbi:MAG: nuclear transport factor 2 family protein [Caulobacteraceae bacterium]
MTSNSSTTEALPIGVDLDRRRFLRVQASVLAISSGLAAVVGESPAAAADASGLAQRVDRLSVEVERVEDIRAIKRLKRAYSHYLELGLWKDLIELFTENAVGDYPAGVFIGRKNLWPHFIDNNGRGILGVENGRIMPHISFQPVINISSDGKTAWGRWKVFAMLGNTGGQASWNGMLYEDRYVKEDGVWKIDDLHTHSEWGGNYVGGWTAVRTPAPRPAAAPGAAPAAPAGGIFARLPHKPERPHNEGCEGFLIKCVFAYHYKAADAGRPIATPTGGDGIATGDLGARYADVMRRVTRLNDEAAVESLQNAYGQHIDRKQWDQAAALFADDGTMEMGQSGVYVGKAHIRRALELTGPQGLRPGEVNDHVNFGQLVTVSADGRTARARGVELVLTGNGAGQGKVVQGIFENAYVKEGDAWKIQSVHFYPRAIADAAKGWGKDFQQPMGPSASTPPDRGPSEVYEIYPKGYFPPLHFVNPVTGMPTQYPEGAPAAKMADAVLAFATARPPASKPRSTADVRASLAATEIQLRRAVGKDAAENLIGAYGYAMDEYGWDDMTALVTDNAVLALDGEPAQAGRAKMRGFLRARFGDDGIPVGQLLNHLVFQPVIQVSADGRSAKIRARLFEMSGKSGGEGMWGAGVYEDEAVLDGDRWKLKSVHLTRTWSARFSDTWTKPMIATNSGATVRR